MNERLERVQTRHKAIGDKIREAEELRARGVPGAEETLRELKVEHGTRTKEESREVNRDYLKRRGRDKEIRSKFEKIIDACRGDL